MASIMQIIRRMRTAFNGATVDRDMDEEMRIHIDMEAADAIRRGESPDEARRQARLAFGAVERFREEGRDAKGLGAVRAAGADLRFALRVLRRSPVFTVVVILTLALGIGANTAIFSVVNGVVLRPLPFDNPDALVSVWDGGHSLAEFEGVATNAKTLIHTAAYLRSFGVSIDREPQPVHVNATLVTARFFDVFGVRAAVGEFFRDGDDMAGGRLTAVLSNALWRTQFGGDSAVVGRVIDVDGVSRTVVGVAPDWFAFPNRDTQIWIPVRIDHANLGVFWGSYGHQIIGRMRDGVTRQQANDDVYRIAAQLQKDNPLWRPELPAYLTNVRTFGLRESLSVNSEHLLFILLGSVGLVLLLACANVANLLMVRGASRAREMAVRTALGAGSGRLARQLVVENLALACIGGIAGIGVAIGSLRALVALLPQDTPRLTEVGIDGAALGFAFLVTVATGLLFGVAPAYRATRGDMAPALRSGRSSGGLGQRRLASVLVSAQICIAVVLAIGAGLLVRSLASILAVDPGFPTERLVSVSVNPPRERYRDPARMTQLATGILDRLQKMPGVISASVSTQVPFDQTNHNMAMWVDGWTKNPNSLDIFELRKVSPEFFKTMGMRILRGRGFTDADAAGAAPVAIVSEVAANTFWPGGDAVGGRMRYPWPGWFTVIGVVSDVHNNDLRAKSAPVMYVPYSQGAEVPLAVVMRTNVDAPAAFAAIRGAVTGAAPDTPVSNEQTLQEMVDRSVTSSRAAAVMLLSFGALALLLGAVGTYGLVAYTVESRQREFAVRMAVGADGRRVIRMVLTHGLRLALIGIVIGVVSAYALSGLVRGLLFGIAPTDIVSFTIAPATLLAAALVACFVPAWRAARVDPVGVLRRD